MLWHVWVKWASLRVVWSQEVCYEHCGAVQHFTLYHVQFHESTNCQATLLPGHIGSHLRRACRCFPLHWSFKCNVICLLSNTRSAEAINLGECAASRRQKGTLRPVQRLKWLKYTKSRGRGREREILLEKVHLVFGCNVSQHNLTFLSLLPVVAHQWEAWGHYRASLSLLVSSLWCLMLLVLCGSPHKRVSSHFSSGPDLGQFRAPLGTKLVIIVWVVLLGGFSNRSVAHFGFLGVNLFYN